MTELDIEKLRMAVSRRLEAIFEGRAVVAAVTVDITRNYERYSYSWDLYDFVEIGPPCYGICIRVHSHDFCPSMADFKKISTVLSGDIEFGSNVVRDTRVKSLQTSNIERWGWGLTPNDVVYSGDFEILCCCRTIDTNDGLEVITQS